MLKLSKQSAEFTPKVVEYLNELVELDQEVMEWLVNTRVGCSMELAEHPTCQVRLYPGDDNPSVGMLGVLNGLFGIDPNGCGPIAAVFEDDGTLTGFICTLRTKS